MKQMNWLQEMAKETQIREIYHTNEYTKEYGLLLSREDTQLLIQEKNEALKKEKRVEFGETIMPKIIYAFCDSPFMNQVEYLEVLIRLQEIFYEYKNEMRDEITDDELLTFMREQFDQVCCGDLDYLEGTCLDLFAQAVRAGYNGHMQSEGKDEFGNFDLVVRWDRELYKEALQELFWG